MAQANCNQSDENLKPVHIPFSDYFKLPDRCRMMAPGGPMVLATRNRQNMFVPAVIV